MEQSLYDYYRTQPIPTQLIRRQKPHAVESCTQLMVVDQKPDKKIKKKKNRPFFNLGVESRKLGGKHSLRDYLRNADRPRFKGIDVTYNMDENKFHVNFVFDKTKSNEDE